MTDQTCAADIMYSKYNKKNSNVHNTFYNTFLLYRFVIMSKTQTKHKSKTITASKQQQPQPQKTQRQQQQMDTFNYVNAYMNDFFDDNQAEAASSSASSSTVASHKKPQQPKHNISANRSELLSFGDNPRMRKQTGSADEIVQFDQIVNQRTSSSSSNRRKNQSIPEVVVIMFRADWCGACQFFFPKFKRISRMPQYAKKILFAEAENDRNGRIMERVSDNINAFPTFMIYKNGKVIKKLEGADEESLTRALDDCVRRRRSVVPPVSAKK